MMLASDSTLPSPFENTKSRSLLDKQTPFLDRVGNELAELCAHQQHTLACRFFVEPVSALAEM
jgi:hypothetical protein